MNSVSTETLRERKRELQFNKKCNIVRHSDTHTSKFIKKSKVETARLRLYLGCRFDVILFHNVNV